jgi:hypothetical protein
MSEFPECLLIVTAEVDAAIEGEWNRCRGDRSASGAGSLRYFVRYAAAAVPAAGRRSAHHSSPSAGGYVLLFASASAHAVARPSGAVLSPRGVAHPPVSMNCRCCQDSIL